MTENFESNENLQPKFVFKKERDFGEIISDTFTFFTQNKKRLFNIFVKYVGPFILLVVISSTIYQYKTGDLLADFSIVGANPNLFFNSIFENILVMIFYLVCTILTTAATYLVIFHSIKSYISNKGEILDSDISKGMKKDFWKMIGYSILFYLVIFLGFMLCFIPGIYLAVVLTPGLALVVMNDISIGDAFSRCFTLIKDNWWITFATFFIFFIIIAILGFIFQLPATIYTFVEGFTGSGGLVNSSEDVTNIYSNWIFLLFSAIAVIGQYFLNIFSVIMISLVFFNLEEKQEFTGTYERIDNIGN